MMSATPPKMGGRAQLRLYVQDAADTTPSLASLPDLAAARYGDRFQLELISEPGAPAAILSQSAPETALPDQLRPVTRAAAEHLWQSAPDIVILSLLPDLCYPLWQNSRTGQLLVTSAEAPETVRAQLAQTDYAATGLVTAAQFQTTLIDLIRAIKERLDAHVLVFNASSIVPGDTTYRFYRQPDTLALRIHKFNLALIAASVAEGISIIDVDRLVADAGGARQVRAPLTYGLEAQQALTHEVLRVLADIGFFEARPLLPQVGQGKK